MNAAESTWWQRLQCTRIRDLVRGRIDGRLDWRRVITAANLPADLSQVIEQVVRRSRLWRSEKVDVAQELIAHFQDGLEAGRSPQQLVDSFGDPAQAAQLIRRAKKRGRSLAWQMWRWACWTMAVLVAFYIGTGIYLVSGRPSVATDYLAIVNKRALSVPEDERAWPLYREALSRMNYLNPVPKWSREDKIKPQDESWPEAVAWLTDHADALAQIRQAAGRPVMGLPVWTSYESYPLEDRRVFLTESDRLLQQKERKFVALEDRWLYSILLPHVQSLRNMARLLAADARRAATEGHSETSYADIVAVVQMSHHCEEQPFFVSSLVAAAVQRLAFGTIQDLLTSQPALWTDDQLRDLAHTIAAAKIDWHYSYSGERFAFRDTVQRMYTDDGHGDGRITDEGLRSLYLFGDQRFIDGVTGLKDWRMRFGNLGIDAVAPASLYVMASRKELEEKYDRFMNQQGAALDRPLWENRGLDVDREINGWSTLEKMRYMPISMLMPTLSALRDSVEAYRGQRDGVLAGIALELYHREHGAWPQTLAELSPQYLPQVPVDRLSGKPLHYRIVEDRPVVYSTGVDGDDDKGRVPRDENGHPDGQLAEPRSFHFVESERPDGDWVIWSTSMSGGE